MRILCSWCKKFMGEKEPYDDTSDTHGKCPECFSKLKKQIQNQTNSHGKIDLSAIDDEGYPKAQKAPLQKDQKIP